MHRAEPEGGELVNNSGIGDAVILGVMVIEGSVVTVDTVVSL